MVICLVAPITGHFVGITVALAPQWQHNCLRFQEIPPGNHRQWQFKYWNGPHGVTRACCNIDHWIMQGMKTEGDHNETQAIKYFNFHSRWTPHTRAGVQPNTYWTEPPLFTNSYNYINVHTCQLLRKNQTEQVWLATKTWSYYIHFPLLFIIWVFNSGTKTTNKNYNNIHLKCIPMIELQPYIFKLFHSLKWQDIFTQTWRIKTSPHVCVPVCLSVCGHF